MSPSRDRVPVLRQVSTTPRGTLDAFRDGADASLVGGLAERRRSGRRVEHEPGGSNGPPYTRPNRRTRHGHGPPAPGRCPSAAAAISDEADPIWMTNGQIRAMARHGDYVYIGGKFTQVRARRRGPTASSLRGTSLVSMSTPASATRRGPPRSSATAGPAVHALVVAGGDVWIGGDFRSVNGQPRHNLAAVSVASGAVDPA